MRMSFVEGDVIELTEYPLGKAATVELDNGFVKCYSAVLTPQRVKSGDRVKITYHNKTPRYISII